MIITLSQLREVIREEYIRIRRKERLLEQWDMSTYSTALNLPPPESGGKGGNSPASPAWIADLAKKAQSEGNLAALEHNFGEQSYDVKCANLAEADEEEEEGELDEMDEGSCQPCDESIEYKKRLRRIIRKHTL